MYLPKRKKPREKRCCPVCEGRGKVKVEEKGGQIKETTCPRCNGSGVIYV